MTPDEARGGLEQHVDRFNETVTSGDWDRFVSTFAVVELDKDGSEARFAWRASGTGTLAIAWRGDAVAELVISFDGA